MSAPKQLAKRQKLDRKRQRKREALRRRDKKQSGNGGLLDFLAPFPMVNGPVGGIKMSKVLEDFVEPLADPDLDYDGYEQLLSMAMVAWNAALEPEYRRAFFISSAIDAAMEHASIWERMACRELIEKLVSRKLEYFANFPRPILAFHLEELEDGKRHLSVVSAVC
jgi:hypothetical protein